MAVQTYSLARDGDRYLSANFRVREFASKDGADQILIDDALVILLQRIRDYYRAPLSINSGYRTPSHNAAVGGATNSQHVQGRAADIVVSGIVPLQVARYAQSLGAGGIGYYPAGQGNFVHVDTRATRYYWDRSSGREVAVSGFGPTALNYSISVADREFFVENIPHLVRAGLINGENYVHLRDFCSALAIGVSYDDATRRIDLTRQATLTFNLDTAFMELLQQLLD